MKRKLLIAGSAMLIALSALAQSGTTDKNTKDKSCCSACTKKCKCDKSCCTKGSCDKDNCSHKSCSNK
ncbi:MAG: hypothetical protein ACLQQ4_19660 [Bacteroidia bacterium]